MLTQNSKLITVNCLLITDHCLRRAIFCSRFIWANFSITSCNYNPANSISAQD